MYFQGTTGFDRCHVGVFAQVDLQKHELQELNSMMHYDPFSSQCIQSEMCGSLNSLNTSICFESPEWSAAISGLWEIDQKSFETSLAIRHQLNLGPEITSKICSRGIFSAHFLFQLTPDFELLSFKIEL